MSYLLSTDRLLLQYLQSRFDSASRLPFDSTSLLEGVVRNMDVCEYLRLFPDNSVDFIFTDEPYGVAPTKVNLKARSDITTDFHWDKTDMLKLAEVYEGLVVGKDSEDPRLPTHMLNEWVLEAHRVLKNPGMLINFGNSEFIGSFRDVCRFTGLKWRASIPWLKTNVAPHFRKNNFRSGHETIYFASKGNTRNVINFLEQQEMVNFIIDQLCPNCGSSFPVIFSNKYDKPEWFNNVDDWDIVEDKLWQFIGENAYEISSLNSQKVSAHGTEKPQWLITKYMTIASQPGQLVVDPFVGSGTTAVVAHKMGRRWAVNDLAPEYAAYVETRMQNQLISFLTE